MVIIAGHFSGFYLFSKKAAEKSLRLNR